MQTIGENSTFSVSDADVGQCKNFHIENLDASSDQIAASAGDVSGGENNIDFDYCRYQLIN